MIFIWKKFSDLTLNELYSIMELRQRVFIEGQNIVCVDADGKDINAWHLLGLHNNELVAYLRVLPPGVKFQECSLGRVAVALDHRKKNYGRKLMAEGLRQIKLTLGAVPIRISAQLYLEKFYMEFGFVKTRGPYIEEGIDHIEMLYSS